MRIDPKHTRNADPAISSIRWDIALIFLIRVGLRFYLRWNTMLMLGSRTGYRVPIIVLMRPDHIDRRIISHTEDLYSPTRPSDLEGLLLYIILPVAIL